MRIQVTVKAGARHEKIEQIGEKELRVFVKSPAIEGRANEAVIEAVARHFDVPKSRVKICLGEAFKKKVVEIDE